MEKQSYNLNIDEMAKAGVNLGHKVSKLHPKMKVNLAGSKNGVHLIDLKKTAEKFTEALNYIQSIIADGKNMLVVGTNVPIKGMVKSNAEEMGLPYVSERWLGGIFTNFETILKRVNFFKDLKKQKETGGLEKYTKKEKMKMEKEIKLLEVKFNGIKDMVKLPEAVLLLDMKKDITAVREARKKSIKIIAICDTNIDPGLIDYPIPANDDAISSIKYILERVKETVLKAKLSLK